jgi:hypothetical protein
MAKSKTQAKELTKECSLGERVRWRTVGGKWKEGTLRDWDNGTAVVGKDDGTTEAVRVK